MESAAYGAGCLRAKAIQYTETQALWGLLQLVEKVRLRRPFPTEA